MKTRHEIRIFWAIMSESVVFIGEGKNPFKPPIDKFISIVSVGFISKIQSLRENWQGAEKANPYTPVWEHLKLYNSWS